MFTSFGYFKKREPIDERQILLRNSVRGLTQSGVQYSFNSFAATIRNEDGYFVDTEHDRFVLFDGHNGSVCKNYLENNFGNIFRDTYRECFEDSKNPIQLETIRSIYSQTDAFYRSPLHPYFSGKSSKAKEEDNISKTTEDDVEKHSWLYALTKAFYTTEKLYYEYLAQLKSPSNCERSQSPNDNCQTVQVDGASVCAIVMTPIGFVIANLGEAGAIMGIRDLESKSLRYGRLSTCHSTDSSSERSRIFQMHKNERKSDVISHFGLLKDSLRVTRSIGDYYLKGGSKSDDKGPLPYMSCLPDVVLQKYSSNIEFIVIGSSGFWHLVSPQEAIEKLDELKRQTNDFPNDDSDPSTLLLHVALFNLAGRGAKRGPKTRLNNRVSGNIAGEKPLEFFRTTTSSSPDEQSVLVRLNEKHCFRPDNLRGPLPSASDIVDDDISVLVIFPSKQMPQWQKAG